MTVACSLLLHCTRKYCGTGIRRQNRADSISFQLFFIFQTHILFFSSSTKRLFSNIFQFRSGHFFYCSPFICFTFFRFFFVFCLICLCQAHKVRAEFLAISADAAILRIHHPFSARLFFIRRFQLSTLFTLNPWMASWS